MAGTHHDFPVYPQTQLLLPVIFTILGLWADGFRPTGDNDPQLSFTYNPFPDRIIPYSVPVGATTTFDDLYIASFPSGSTFNVDLNVSKDYYYH